VFSTSVGVFFVRFLASMSISEEFKEIQNGRLTLFFTIQSICSSLDSFILSTSNQSIFPNNSFKKFSNAVHFA
jgi:hypothetical protein